MLAMCATPQNRTGSFHRAEHQDDRNLAVLVGGGREQLQLADLPDREAEDAVERDGTVVLLARACRLPVLLRERRDGIIELLREVGVETFDRFVVVGLGIVLEDVNANFFQASLAGGEGFLGQRFDGFGD